MSEFPVFLPITTDSLEWRSELIKYTETGHKPDDPLWHQTADRGSLTLGEDSSEQKGNGKKVNICVLDSTYSSGLIQQFNNPSSKTGASTASTSLDRISSLVEEVYLEAPKASSSNEESSKVAIARQWFCIQKLEERARGRARWAFHCRVVVAGMVIGSVAYGRIFGVAMPVLGSTMSPVKWGALAGVTSCWEIKPFENDVKSPRLHKFLVPLGALYHTIANRKGLLGLNTLSTTGLMSFAFFWWVSRQLQSRAKRLTAAAVLHLRGYGVMQTKLSEQSRDLSSRLFDHLHTGKNPEDWNQLCEQAQQLIDGASTLRQTYAFPFKTFETEVLPVCRRIVALRDSVNHPEEDPHDFKRQRLLEAYLKHERFGDNQSQEIGMLVKVAGQVAQPDSSLGQPQEIEEVVKAAQKLLSNRKNQGKNRLPGLKDMCKLPYRILRLKAEIAKLQQSIREKTQPPQKLIDEQNKLNQKIEKSRASNQREVPKVQQRLQKIDEAIATFSIAPSGLTTQLDEKKKALEALKHKAQEHHDTAQALQTLREGLSLGRGNHIPDAAIEFETQIIKPLITFQAILDGQAIAWHSGAEFTRSTKEIGNHEMEQLVNQLCEKLDLTGIDFSAVPVEIQNHLRNSVPSPMEEGEGFGDVRARLTRNLQEFNRARAAFREILERYAVYETIEQDAHNTPTWTGKLAYAKSCAQTIKQGLDSTKQYTRNKYSRAKILPQVIADLLKLTDETLSTLAQCEAAPDVITRYKAELQANLATQRELADQLIRTEEQFAKNLEAYWVDPLHFELAIALVTSNPEDSQLLRQLDELSQGTAEPRAFVNAVFKKRGVVRNEKEDDIYHSPENAAEQLEHQRELFHRMTFCEAGANNSEALLICDRYLYFKHFDKSFATAKLSSGSDLTFDDAVVVLSSSEKKKHVRRKLK